LEADEVDLVVAFVEGGGEVGVGPEGEGDFGEEGLFIGF
jgi:hypothetical protein